MQSANLCMRVRVAGGLALWLVGGWRRRVNCFWSSAMHSWTRLRWVRARERVWSWQHFCSPCGLCSARFDSRRARALWGDELERDAHNTRYAYNIRQPLSPHSNGGGGFTSSRYLIFHEKRHFPAPFAADLPSTTRKERKAMRCSLISRVWVCISYRG